MILRHGLVTIERRWDRTTQLDYVLITTGGGERICLPMELLLQVSEETTTELDDPADIYLQMHSK